MTLKEMAVTYRLEADRLRHRIQLVRELPTRTEVERTAKIERLRLLEAMRPVSYTHLTLPTTPYV